jgi:RWD domain
MSDHCEEQEMEAEALTAIFDDCLHIVNDKQPFAWEISLWPEQHSPEENHVGIKLLAKIPLDYPEVSLPEFSIEILKGLTPDHADDLLAMAKEEAEANMGLPSIFAVCERLREWLAENNIKGMDDVSMYAQMIRREKEKEKEEVCVCVCRNDWLEVPACGGFGGGACLHPCSSVHSVFQMQLYKLL